MIKRFLICILTLGVLTACVYDQYVPEQCPVVSDGETYYMSFVLSGSGDSRTKAGSDGNDIGLPGEELLVKKVDLYFYADEKPLQGPLRLNKREITQFAQQVSSSQTDDIANKVYDFTVKLSFRPYLILVAVNMDKDLQGLSLPEARAEMLEGDSSSWHAAATTISYGGTDYPVRPFRMTSSSYVSQEGRERCELPIPNEFIWRTEDEAKNNAPFEIYLDRVAAKVNVVEPASTTYKVPVVTQYPGIKAQVELLGWGLNGLNKKSYCYKKIDTGWDFTWTSVTWNEPSKYRSHWAQDPNYTSGDYPFDYQEYAGTYSQDTDLEYVSWDALTGTFAPSATPTLNPQYCLENTADGTLLARDPDANALFPKITHVLIKARLSFAVGEGFTAAGDVAGYTTASDFYRYRGVFYTAANIMQAVLADLKAEGRMLYTDSAHTVEATASDFALTHLFGERFYPSIVGSLYDGAGSAVAADYLKDKVYIGGFKNGNFYYKVPIEHLTPEPSTPGANYETAQYGVVRDHNYILEMADVVGGIGTGVWETNQPIVPVTRNDDYVLSTHMTVTPWKQFETRMLFVDPSGMLVTDGQIIDRWQDGDNPQGNDWNGNGWYF